MSLVRKKRPVLQLLFSTLVLGSTVLAAEPPRDPIPPGGGRLRNHWATCVIGLNSGHVGGIWDNISGRRLVQESYETYRLTTREGKTITVSDAEIREALAETMNVIVDAVRVALERTPPELSADIVDRGIVMTGGGALLKNLDKRLREETGLPLAMAEDPLSCVVLGVGKMLSDFGLLRKISKD